MNYRKQAGEVAEKDARWQIDRYFCGSKNWKILHDLVLTDPRSSSICQIDHLAIGRMCDFLVMETKSAVNGMLLNQDVGAFSILSDGIKKPVKSPVVQNMRHIEVLKSYCVSCNMLPKRWGIQIQPTFHNWILVQPGSELPLTYNGAKLIQRDQFGLMCNAWLTTWTIRYLTSAFKTLNTAELDYIALRLLNESAKNKAKLSVRPGYN